MSRTRRAKSRRAHDRRRKNRALANLRYVNSVRAGAAHTHVRTTQRFLDRTWRRTSLAPRGRCKSNPKRTTSRTGTRARLKNRALANYTSPSTPSALARRTLATDCTRRPSQPIVGVGVMSRTRRASPERGFQKIASGRTYVTASSVRAGAANAGDSAKLANLRYGQLLRAGAANAGDSTASRRSLSKIDK